MADRELKLLLRRQRLASRGVTLAWSCATTALVVTPIAHAIRAHPVRRPKHRDKADGNANQTLSRAAQANTTIAAFTT